MKITRRGAIVGLSAGAAMLTMPRGAFAQAEAFTPEMFGAVGDGVTNDSLAFASLARAVNQAGGGVIRLRRTTYLVGGHNLLSRDPHWSFAPQQLLELRGCSHPVIIEGGGARIRCGAGFRYGSFDRLSGAPIHNAQPFYGSGQAATPYTYMILVEDCRGPVRISDLELDGNLSELQIGGPWGDTGWQVPAVGIFLRNNSGDEIIRNVHAHHHAQDGIMIDGRTEPALARRVRRQIENVRSEYNGRQGCSIIGGLGYVFTGCRFNHTGRAGLASAPGAGVDIEAEGEKTNRALTFIDCEFSDNVGVGFLAEAGDNAEISCRNCRFIGTTVWSAWPNAPRMRFEDSTFVGAVVRIHGHDNPALATQFVRCTFLDDPKFSPTGKVYTPGSPHGAIADLAFGQNAKFTRCVFRLTHNGLLPWGWRTIYEDCTLSQKATTVSFPKGEYRGYNTLTGMVDLYNTKVTGTLVVNGEVHRGPKLLGGEPW